MAAVDIERHTQIRTYHARLIGDLFAGSIHKIEWVMALANTAMLEPAVAPLAP